MPEPDKNKVFPHRASSIPAALTLKIEFNCKHCGAGNRDTYFAITMMCVDANRVLAVECPLCHKPLFKIVEGEET